MIWFNRLTYPVGRSLTIVMLLLLLLLSRVTWRVLIATARVLRLTRPRSSRVCVWLWPVSLVIARVVLGSVTLVTSWIVIGLVALVTSRVVLWNAISVIDLSSWIMITTWRYRCTRIGSWTIRVTMPGIILRRAWVRPKGRHIAGGSIGTKKIPFVKTDKKKREKAVIKMPRLKENNVYRFLQMRYQKFLDYTRSRSLQTTTSSTELASHEEVLLARHAILPNAWRTPKYVCLGGYNRVACWKLQRLDSGVQREVRERQGKGGREAVFFLLIPSLRRPHNLIAWKKAVWPRAFPFSLGKSTGDEITQKRGDQLCASRPLTLYVYFLFVYHMHVIKSVESRKHSHPIRWHNRTLIESYKAQSPHQVPLPLLLLDLLKHPPPRITQMSKRGSVSVHSNNWSVWPVTIITFRLENTSRGTGEEKITGDSLD